MNQNKNRSTQEFGALQKWSFGTVEARTFDDYRKAEGLMVDRIILPDGIEIKEKE
jgi:hypothetical protein